MNWETLDADVDRIMNKHYTPGRDGHTIKYIVRHHNAGVNLTTEDCWRLWQDREASAHYQVENSGRIGQLVNDWDTAWHAANLQRNQESIGIEHANCGGPDDDWPISATVIDQGAHLAAALCKAYNLGRPEFGRNIRDHRETGQTSCPYHLAQGGIYHDQWMAKAQRYYDQMIHHATTTPPQEDTMTPEEHAALNDAKVAAQDARDAARDAWLQLGAGNSYAGFPQGGDRTLYDLVAAIAAKLEVHGARDTKA